MNTRISLTTKKIQVYNLARPNDKKAYEALLNDPNVHHINKEDISPSRTTGYPIVTVWYEVIDDIKDEDKQD